MARTVVSPPVVFAATPVPFAGEGGKAAESGHWITVGEGADAHHLFLPAGGFAALKREKLAPGETHHIVSGGKAFGDKSEPKVGQTFFHAGSKQYLTTVRTDSHSIGPAERTGYGLQQGHAVAHHAYARPATEEEAAPHKDAEAAKAKLVGADVLRENLKQQFRKTGQAIDADERVDDPQPGKSYQIHVGSAWHLNDRATDFLPHTRQKKRDNDAFYVTPTRTALLDATNGHKKYVLPTTPELIGHIASIENIRAEGEHDLATAYGRKDETERRVRQGLARHSADGPALFAAPAVAFKDYPYGPEEGHWVTIDGEHVLIRGGRPGEHEHAKPARERGYEGDAGGMIHEDAVKVRHSLLDAAAAHEAKLAEHDSAIQEHSNAIQALAKQSDDHPGGSPEYNHLIDQMVTHEDAQVAHLSEKKNLIAAMHASISPILNAPTPSVVVPDPHISMSASGKDVANHGARIFGGLVDKSVLPHTEHPIFQETKEGRSFYEPKVKAVVLSDTAGRRSALHELGHWLEGANQTVRERAERFLEKRTSGQSEKKLSSVVNESSYDDNEVTVPDHFMNPYMGKQYMGSGGTREATEIMSMGLEKLGFVDSAVAFAKADPEMFDFIVSTAHGMHLK